MTRGIVAEFHKDSGGRLKLFSMTTLTEETCRSDGKTYISQCGYDVEWSRKWGYIWHMSSAGAFDLKVEGIYFISGDVPEAEIIEEPVTLVDYRDKPPWRSNRTKAIRERNRTRRLRQLPKAFEIREGEDLVDWLERNAIQDEAVFCATCRDYMPGEGYDLCEHVWWCDKTGSFSTPQARCDCKDRDECRDRAA